MITGTSDRWRRLLRRPAAPPRPAWRLVGKIDIDTIDI
jgi:hypothetical protein